MADVASRIREAVVGMPRYPKRAILIITDLLALTVIMQLTFQLRYLIDGKPPPTDTFLLSLLAPIITVAVYWWSGFYRVVTRFMRIDGYVRIGVATLLATLIFGLILFMSGITGMPRTVVVIYCIAGGASVALLRYAAGVFLRNIGIELGRVPLDFKPIPVLIYGAGSNGIALATAMNRSSVREVIGFIDREPSLWRQYVAGKKVYRPDRLRDLVTDNQVKEVLLSTPQIRRQQRRVVLDALVGLDCTVKVMPGLEEIASGEVSITDLRPVSVDDLLGRDPVPPQEDLLAGAIQDRVIMVTGAGGSVGSEIVRQIMVRNPKKLVLVDHHEPALFVISQEIIARQQAKLGDATIAGMGTPSSPTGEAPVEAPSKISVVPLLGSVTDADFMRRSYADHSVETVFHAAAYKHVPLSEVNVAATLFNNTIGCTRAARLASEEGIGRFILISTDKAVRPTSVMGASKRLAEMALTAMSQKSGNTTIFSMVRFGNVLDSSGSVVQLFRQQIEKGGPVTVTSPQMTRFFMSIPEAATLVIQA
ncbi:MAG: polysaccharide biosynthesis protein, partial [Pseudomonadota bacterium]